MMAHLLPLTGEGVDQLENGRAAHGPVAVFLGAVEAKVAGEMIPS